VRTALTSSGFIAFLRSLPDGSNPLAGGSPRKSPVGETRLAFFPVRLRCEPTEIAQSESLRTNTHELQRRHGPAGLSHFQSAPYSHRNNSSQHDTAHAAPSSALCFSLSPSRGLCVDHRGWTSCGLPVRVPLWNARVPHGEAGSGMQPRRPQCDDSPLTFFRSGEDSAPSCRISFDQ